MPAPTLFDLTQSVLALIVVIGSGVLTALGVLTVEPLIAIISMVLGYYFGAARSNREIDAIERAARMQVNNPGPVYTERSFGGITVKSDKG